jgi:hypothetical protein
VARTTIETLRDELRNGNGSMNLSAAKVVVIATTLIIYGYFCGGYANNVCMNAIGDLTMAITDQHSVQIDRYHENSNDISVRDGHFYSGFAPGLSFLMVPVYLAMKPIFAVIPTSVMDRLDSSLSNAAYAKHGRLRSTESRARVVMLIVAATLGIAAPLGMLVTFYILRTCRLLFPELSTDDTVRLAIITTFGTIIAAFSIHLTHTAVAACLVWIVIARVLNASRETAPVPGVSVKAMLWNGLLLGFAPVIDYPASLYALYAALFIVCLNSETRIKTALLLGAGAAPSLASSWAYHFVAFGSPFTNAYRFRVRTVDRAIFDIRDLGPTLPNPEKLYAAFLHPYSGLVLYHPLLLLSGVLAGYFLIVERRRLQRLFWGLAAATIVTNVGIYCTYPLNVGPSSGPIFAVRYTMYSTPFALVALAALLVQLRTRHIAPTALVGLAVLNAVPVFAFVLYGSPVYPSRGYWALLTQLGPANYTLTKLFEARILNTPIFSWLGVCVIASLFIYWRRAVGDLIREWIAPTAGPPPQPRTD